VGGDLADEPSGEEAGSDEGGGGEGGGVNTLLEVEDVLE
jgi:hypothetical protein